MSSEKQMGVRIDKVEPTVFLRRGPQGLEQRVRLTLVNSGQAVSGGIEIQFGSERQAFGPEPIPAGESVRDVFIKEAAGACSAAAELKIDGATAGKVAFELKPPRHWIVHVVHESHHDVGYTDLASNVVREHDRHLDRVIDFASATNDFPDDAKFRMVIEQAWSVDHYLKNAPSARAAALIDLMKSGRVELTALFGNMTSELCGHETLARSVYHAFRLKREHGIPIISAENNDVPGFAWGLASVLIETGVKIFCPGLPHYYNWGQSGSVRSFWDNQAVIGYDGPGAFWWEAPNGKRVLFWHGNSGAGGDYRVKMPGLEGRLAELEKMPYPFSTLRWVVIGASRDNSPYIGDYAQTIREWNETWAYPHLVCSTNARFYEELIKQLPANLPVHRGELPCQDYTCGAMSTTAATTINRNNHAAFPVAERLAAIARAVTGTRDRQPELTDANEEILWHDEHTWGHHFPCGPANRAGELEKAVHAHRAAALLHDVTCKATAAIADAVRIDEQFPHLVVFNPHPYPCGGMVRTPLREMDNCGSEIVPLPVQDDPSGHGHLRGVILNDHWHVNPELNFVDGLFDLIDTSTGQAVPFEILTIDSADLPVPFAGQRLGIGSGGKRYGGMEVPLGLKRELVFKITEMLACGYKTFSLKPRPEKPAFATPFTVTENSIENEYYRITADRASGTIVSILDKERQVELIDRTSPLSFGEVVVRNPDRPQVYRSENRSLTPPTAGPMVATIGTTMKAPGHPHIRQVFTLYPGEKRIDVGLRIVKDSTPLLDVHAAFPFAVDAPTFRYEGNLTVMSPVADYFPGAYWNSLPVQNWVRVADRSSAVAWSSLDTPIVSLGGLWALAVSPAHRCTKNADTPQPTDTANDLKHGWIFSTLFANNFGTNFSASQNGDFLFRYSFTSGPADGVDARQFGRHAVAPFEAIITQHHRTRTLPAEKGFLQIEPSDVNLLTCKRAEDERGYILRLWNAGEKAEKVKIRVGFMQVKSANRTTLAEEDLPEAITCQADGLAVDCPANTVVTIRLK